MWRRSCSLACTNLADLITIMNRATNQGDSPLCLSTEARTRIGLILLAGFLCLSSTMPAQSLPREDAGMPPVPPAEPETGDDGGIYAEQPPFEVEIATARVVEAGRPGHRKVRGVRVFKKDGGRVDWSRQGDWIAFDKAEGEGEGFYHIYIMKPDGTREKCVTCNQWDFRKTNALSPAWHPSGEYLVFQVQEQAGKLGLDTLKLTTPHRGLHSELWIIDIKGRQPFKLTQVTERGNALLDPHFSHEADMLVWSQRVVSLGRWGEWEPHVGQFQIKRGVPRLSKVKSYRPTVQKGFVAAHGFTPNDRGLLISAVPDPGRSAIGRDILELDLETNQLKRLTSSPKEWDELVSALPRGDGVVWVSDRNIERPRDRQLPRRGDVWHMSAGGRRQERLTFFNNPESDHFLGEALIDDLAWSPEGDKLLLHVVSAGAPGSGSFEQAIYIVELDGAIGVKSL